MNPHLDDKTIQLNAMPKAELHCHLDGILDRTTVATSLPPMAGVDLTIGADSEGSGNYFEGLIDEVALYDRALTTDEIRQSY